MTQKTENRFDGSPLDAPVLHGLTEVEFVRDLLSTHKFDESAPEEMEGFEVRILKKHLRKTIIEYVVRFHHSTKNFIGLYRESDDRLGLSFSVLKTLRSNGFGEGSRLAVPSPILYLPALSFLMMEKAEGETLREILKTRVDPIPHVKGAARWLARLHSSNITLDRLRSQDDEIAASLRFTKATSWLFPRFKSEIESISKQLIDAQKSLSPGPRKPIHGDYHPKNIIISSQLTTVIDFEEARMGDPAFDLGYFVAQTKMTHGTAQAIIQATETFLQEYRESQPTAEGNFSQRVAVFEAQTYLQRIYHTYHLLALKPDFDLIREWLHQSEGCLERTRSTSRSRE